MPTPTSLAPTITLSNGVEMPQLGLGTWPMDDAEAARVVAQAIGMGYRLIDTAENYDNERGVGEGLRASGVPREQVFITNDVDLVNDGTLEDLVFEAQRMEACLFGGMAP